MHPRLQSCKRLQHSRGRAGFTMVELTVASAIGAMILLAVVTTYIFCLKGFSAISNYSQIQADSRYVLNLIARDVRPVNSITSFNSTNSLVVTIPTTVSSSGSITATKTVTYTLSNRALFRTDSATGFTDRLATNITSLTMTLYDRNGSNTTVLTSAKGVQVDLVMQKSVRGKTQSQDSLSARIDMRNIP